LAIVGCSRAPEYQSILVTPQPPRPTPDTRAAREAHIAEALARAPHLGRAAAELLAEGAERRAGAWGDPMDASLLEAARGFSRLEPADLKELGTLFGEAYATLSPSDRAAVEGYVERVRRGDAGPSDERSRVLLARAVQALPEARRARLQSLIEHSIRSALESERLTALAQRDAPHARSAAPPPAWDAPQTREAGLHRPARPEPTPDHGAEDQALRAAGAAYRDQLARLEEMVRYAEQDVRSAERSVEVARQTPLNKRPLGDPEVNAAEQRLQDARAGLQRARNAVDDLQTKIRRERIPSQYVQ
jgi:hypothetical protein